MVIKINNYFYKINFAIIFLFLVQLDCAIKKQRHDITVGYIFFSLSYLKALIMRFIKHYIFYINSCIYYIVLNILHNLHLKLVVYHVLMHYIFSKSVTMNR